MKKAALHFKSCVTDKFVIYLVYFQTRFGISVVRRVGNTARCCKWVEITLSASWESVVAGELWF